VTAVNVETNLGTSTHDCEEADSSTRASDCDSIIEVPEQDYSEPSLNASSIESNNVISSQVKIRKRKRNPVEPKYQTMVRSVKNENLVLVALVVNRVLTF
jgi:hypothetical protein